MDGVSVGSSDVTSVARAEGLPAGRARAEPIALEPAGLLDQPPRPRDVLGRFRLGVPGTVGLVDGAELMSLAHTTDMVHFAVLEQDETA
jgi:hypothetical protein